jgi:anaerobic selenocysteine-containing dehydrogenase
MTVPNVPPPETWDDVVEFDAQAWPERVERHSMLVPTACFNCESGCGLLAWVDRETLEIRRFEGNPLHPGSRGRVCAKGPATLSQVKDGQRILYPLKRTGPRGSGQFERVGWDEALDLLAASIRRELVEGRKTTVMYHVGRPGHDGAMERVLQAWGIDGHNSHTNVCSAAARLGYALTQGGDRPSPDHANAKFILLLSAHLETGHYFNPHAQRIMEAHARGAKIAAIDVRLSNTAAIADWWLAPHPGTEAALLLAIATVLLREDRVDWPFVERWTNWRVTLEALRPGTEPTLDAFKDALRAHYAWATPEFAAAECGVSAATLVDIAHEIANAGSAFSAHVWRNAASGNLGGWQVARALSLVSILAGAIGTVGGTNLAPFDKFVPPPALRPPPQDAWNPLTFPDEYPLSHHELSFLLPHFLAEGRGRLAVYFTRVYNPVWTNPDGLTWERALLDESQVGLHAALTPTWNETAELADLVLPMGLGPERHDLQSQETHAAQWIVFRQPVRRVALERLGRPVSDTRDANPGEVWEEEEFWIALSWRIDPDGSLGIRRWFESPSKPGTPLTVDEHYAWIFENSVPGLPQAAASHGLTPLQYMRRFGAFEVQASTHATHERPVATEGAEIDPAGTVRRDGKPIGLVVDGRAVSGFPTPSRRLELWSPLLAAWGWPEHAMPGYIESHVRSRTSDELVLVPTFRLPVHIHTRSANSKWLMELANNNPVWLHPTDADRIGVATGDLVRVITRIGHMVDRAWVTEAIRPGVVAASHHLGRWRRHDTGVERWASARVARDEIAPGVVRLRRAEHVGPVQTVDPDSTRVTWTEGGVHENLIFPVQPDPVSGMHCWHQVVRVERAAPDDCYGDLVVDTKRSTEVYREWLAKTRPATGDLHRPLELARAVRPVNAAYRRR